MQVSKWHSQPLGCAASYPFEVPGNQVLVASISGSFDFVRALLGLIVGILCLNLTNCGRALNLQMKSKVFYVSILNCFSTLRFFSALQLS